LGAKAVACPQQGAKLEHAELGFLEMKTNNYKSTSLLF